MLQDDDTVLFPLLCTLQKGVSAVLSSQQRFCALKKLLPSSPTANNTFEVKLALLATT